MAVAAAVELPLREGLFIRKNQTPDIFYAQWQAQLYTTGGAGLNICLCRTSKCQLFLRPHQQSMLHIWAWSPSFLKSWRYEKRLNNFGLQHRHFQTSVLQMKKEERRHLGQPATFEWGETISCWRFLHFSHGQHRPYFQTTVLNIFSELSVLAKSDRQDLARFRFKVQSKSRLKVNLNFGLRDLDHHVLLFCQQSKQWWLGKTWESHLHCFYEIGLKWLHFTISIDFNRFLSF